LAMARLSVGACAGTMEIVVPGKRLVPHCEGLIWLPPTSAVGQSRLGAVSLPCLATCGERIVSELSLMRLLFFCPIGLRRLCGRPFGKLC